MFLYDFKIPYNTESGKVINGDIPAFASGVPGSGTFQTGFFAIMMFGLPAAALAMILNAKNKQRKLAWGLLGSAGLVSFFTGVTEPIEYSFIYAAPLLYGIYILLGGIFSFLLVFLNFHIGFGFSASLIDYIISLPISLQLTAQGFALNPLWLLAIGPGISLVYFIVFYWSIKIFGFATPGTEENLIPEFKLKNKKHPKGIVIKDGLNIERLFEAEKIQAKEADIIRVPFFIESAKIIKYLGGYENITNIDNCLTRLRLIVKDIKKVDKSKIKSTTSAIEIVVAGSNSLQIIIGQNVQIYVDRINNNKDIIEKFIKNNYLDKYAATPEEIKFENKLNVKSKKINFKFWKRKK